MEATIFANDIYLNLSWVITTPFQTTRPCPEGPLIWSPMRGFAVLEYVRQMVLFATQTLNFIYINCVLTTKGA